MFKVILSTTAFLISLISFSQVSETRTVSDFSKLKASQGIEVLYTVSNTVSVKVETDDNERMGYVKTEVEGGTLKVYIETGKKNYQSSKRSGRNIDGVNFKILKVYITGKALSSVKSSSSSKITIENLNSADSIDLDVSSSGSISGKFNADKITIDASSSGDIRASLEAKDVRVETSSSSDVTLSGKTEKLSVKSSSSSSCDADKLIAEEVVADASSSADINLNVVKSLTAKASSSADIDYTGNPSQIVKDQHSSGSVNHK